MKEKIEEYPEAAQKLVAEIAQRVQEARAKVGISQAAGVLRTQKGDYGSVSQSAWSRIENGQMSFDFLQLFAIAQALNTSPLLLAFGATPPDAHPVVVEVAHHISRNDIPSAINALVRLLAESANK